MIDLSSIDPAIFSQVLSGLDVASVSILAQSDETKVGIYTLMYQVLFLDTSAMTEMTTTTTTTMNY